MAVADAYRRATIGGAGIPRHEIVPRQYPALHRCMLVESRYSMRADVVKALRAAMLFENIVEAASLRDGIEQLATSSFDACIVGTSVTPSKAIDFISRAQQATQGRDCAFIVLAREGDEAIVMPASAAPCHTVQWPCTTKSLFDGIVIAVVKSNGEKSWTGVLQHSPPEMQDAQASEGIEAPIDPMDALPPASPQELELPQKLHQRSDGEILSSLLSGGFADLGDIVARVERKELGLDANRRPTAPSAEALQQILTTIIPPHLESKRIRDFRMYFDGALSLWFVDLCTYGAAIATNNLRHSLFDYARSNFQ